LRPLRLCGEKINWKEYILRIEHFFDTLDISATNALVALGVAVLSYLILSGAIGLIRRRLRRLSEQGDGEAHPIAVFLTAVLSHTSALAIIVTSILIGLTVLDLPKKWDDRVGHLWFISLGWQFALYANAALVVAARQYFVKHSKGSSGPESIARTFTIWVLQIILWALFVLTILANLGVNITTFVASLGIGGIAIALAVQNILGDLFASLSIAIDKPFEVGDAIDVAGVNGTVELVGLKTTRIRSLTGEQIVISNAELLKNTVRNYKRMTTRRVAFSLKINPATDSALVEKVPSFIKDIIEAQSDVRFDRAHFKGLEQSFLEFEIVYFMLTPDYAQFMNCQQTVLLSIMRVLKENRISMAMAAQYLEVHTRSADKAAVAEDEAVQENTYG
jgi:small-conductance mechanosensitive channel